jgi:hypothetical protein
MMSPEWISIKPTNAPVSRIGLSGVVGLVIFASWPMTSRDIEEVGIGDEWTKRVPHSLQNKVPTNS